MTSQDTIRTSERGSALVYILIAIALLAALTIAFMEPSSQQTSSQNTFKAVSEVSTQVDFIRSTIQECVLLYEKGDSERDPGTGNYRANAPTQMNPPFPLMPDNPYLDNCGATPAVTNHLVSSLRCPGNSPVPGGDPCHAQMFGANSGKFLSPPPPLFSQWQYYAGADGVFFWIETAATDPFLGTVLDKLDASYAQCEADIVDTSVGGLSAKALDSGSTILCPSGSRCFRVWILGKPSNVYNGDGGAALAANHPGNESGCP